MADRGWCQSVGLWLECPRFLRAESIVGRDRAVSARGRPVFFIPVTLKSVPHFTQCQSVPGSAHGSVNIEPHSGHSTWSAHGFALCFGQAVAIGLNSPDFWPYCPRLACAHSAHATVT